MAVLEESGRTMLLDGEAQLQELAYEPRDGLARHDEASISVFLRHKLLCVCRSQASHGVRDSCKQSFFLCI
jgi:hypothetical protein